MTFVNEYISKEDFEKYDLTRIDMQHTYGGSKRKDWTVDHVRDIYLRHIASPKEEDYAIWTFYWKGELLWFERSAPYGLSVLGPDGRRYARTVIRNLKLPPHLEMRRSEIYDDLRDAFLVYGRAGILTPGADYVNQIEFQE